MGAEGVGKFLVTAAGDGCAARIIWNMKIMTNVAALRDALMAKRVARVLGGGARVGLEENQEGGNERWREIPLTN